MNKIKLKKIKKVTEKFQLFSKSPLRNNTKLI